MQIITYQYFNAIEHISAHLLTCKHNISPEERSAIKRLNDNPNLIIKPADKGSGIVLMNTCDYVYEAYKQLNDYNFYEELSSDQTELFHLEVIQVLVSMKQREEIDQKCFSFLAAGPTKPGRFYLLPKIHKGKLPPPGRPIISAIGSPTEKISQFLDFFLAAPSPANALLCKGHWWFSTYHLQIG